MNYSQGSVWRRWDLHVHTPGTLKNDQFECDVPVDEISGMKQSITPEERLRLKWEKFYSSISDYIGDGSDLNKAIEVIGITDYNSIENYKKVISEKKLPKSIKMVIPNIEMRLSLISGKSPVNIHFLFDPALKPEVIEERFLGSIKLKYDGSTYSATKIGLIRLGQKIAKQENKTLDDDGAYRLGVEQYIVDLSSLQELFEEDADLKEHVLIMVANGGEDGISGYGKKRGDNKEESADIQRQTSTKRESVYKFVDGLFTSNLSDVNHFLGKDGKISPNEVINFFGSLKPCVHGSDAHCLNRLFEPDGKKYCWIKADPTFEGLKQIIYEPEERVFIGPECPDKKDSHYVIKSIKFDDKNFQKDEIIFNSNLNCIIGGKSTGKTLLLRNMAKSIDPEYVEKQIKSLQETREPLNVEPPVVTWMDGSTEKRKIVYIPQTFLNHSVEDKEGFSAKNEIISDYLLQIPDISKLHDAFDNDLSEIHKNTENSIRSFFRTLRTIKKIEDDLLKDGQEGSFESIIEVLDAKKKDLAEGADFSEEKLERFTRLNNEFDCVIRGLDSVQIEMDLFNKINNPKILIPGIIKENAGNYENDFSRYPILKDQLSSFVAENEKNVCVSWKQNIEKMKSTLNEKKEELEKKKTDLEKELLPLKQQSEKNKSLHDILDQIKKEKTKLEIAKSRTQKKNELLEELKELKVVILKSLTEFKSVYEEYVSSVKSTNSYRNTSLEIKIHYEFKKESFNQYLQSVFVKKTQDKIKNILNFDFFEWTCDNYSQENINKMFDFIEQDFKPDPDYIRRGNQYENILLQLFSNWYHVQYDVTFDGDSLSQMSPGKKAAVYLELLISLTNVKCPILIDQPEDDLDNRSIYRDLVEYIKSKKKERQIIIVTHNANLVVGADAEEVIIANKNNLGDNQKLFEYRSGSIENNEASIKSDNILFKKGIQAQICDILEGGKNAFENRKNKYSSVKS